MTVTQVVKRTNVRSRVFGMLFIVILINFIDRSVLSISLPYISHDIHLTSTEQGWLLGSFFWTYLLFQIPGGWLLDRFGPRKVVALAGTVWGAFELLAGFATGGIFLIGTRLGIGAAEAPVYPAGAKLNSNWLSSKERARGATVMDAASPAGAALGGLIVTLLIGVFGSWRWAFYVTGALTILVAVIYYIYLRDTPERHPKVNQEELDHVLRDREAAGGSKSNVALPRVRDYATSLSFWGMWFGRLGWALAWWGIISWTPSYLVNVLHFNLAALGWGTFFIYGMGFVGEIASGFVTDYLRSRTTSYNRMTKIMLAISGVCGAVAIFTIPFISNGYAALISLGIAVFFILFGGLYWAIPSWLAPAEHVGRVGGVMNIASSAGGALAPVIMGYAISASGGSYVGSFIFLGVAAVVYVVGSLLINFERPLARPSRLDTESVLSVV